MRPCTYEELGLDTKEEISDTAKFYPVHQTSKVWLEFYYKRLKCYDEQVDIHGDYDSNEMTHLHVYFERCKPSKTQQSCATDEEFYDFTQNLFYIHVINSVKFSQTGFGDKKLKKESRLVWNRLRSGNIGDEIFYRIYNKEIRL